VTDDPSVDSEHRRAVVLSYYRNVDAEDFDAVLSIFHPDAVYHRPGYEPLSGIARLTSFYKDQRVIASGQHSVDGIVVDGEFGSAWGTFTGLSRNGDLLEMTFCEVWGFARDLVTYRRSYFFVPAPQRL
jgi:ketosteroid isomerase-like protein